MAARFRFGMCRRAPGALPQDWGGGSHNQFRMKRACSRKQIARAWRNGRRKGLKIPRERSRAGSSPAARTSKIKYSRGEALGMTRLNRVSTVSAILGLLPYRPGSARRAAAPQICFGEVYLRRLGTGPRA